MPIPGPRRPRPTLKPAAARPPSPSIPGTRAPATPGERPPLRRPTGGRTAPRRRVAARPSAEDDILHRFLIKAGIAVVVLVLGGFGTRSAFSSSSPDQRYFVEFARLSRAVEDDSVSREELLRRANALPISGVTDAKLQEVHRTLLSLLTFQVDRGDPTAVERLKALARRFDQLVDELNSKYAR